MLKLSKIKSDISEVKNVAGIAILALFASLVGLGMIFAHVSRGSTWG